MSYNQREIVLVPFPFTDLSSIKQRPALIISTNSFNQKEDVLVLAITSKIKQDKFRITISQKEIETGNLLLTSQVRCDKIYTLNKSIIRKKIAKIKEDSFEQII